MASFRLGDNVTWTSSAQGSWTWKTGTVVYVLAPNEDPWKVIPKLRSQLYLEGKRDDFKCQFDGRFGRPAESYFVLVGDGKRQAKLYWPRLNRLEPA
ncbi:hypothetical protein JCM15519_07450 [Fundidesulfovibrio butyratiphilus]